MTDEYLIREMYYAVLDGDSQEIVFDNDLFMFSNKEWYTGAYWITSSRLMSYAYPSVPILF
jgi:hypothetical protein